MIPNVYTLNKHSFEICEAKPDETLGGETDTSSIN